MGVFTEQVQGLVSEAQIKRKKQEEKEQEKKYLQKLEEKLHYIFVDTFMENKDAKKTYIYLTTYNAKCEILRAVTKNIKKDKQERFYYLLDLKYNKILNNVKQNFLIQYNEEQKNKKELEKEIKKQIVIADRKKAKTGIIIFATVIAVLIEIIKILAIVFLVPLVFVLTLFIHKR